MLPMKNVSCRSWSAKGKKSEDFRRLSRISCRPFRTPRTELDWNPSGILNMLPICKLKKSCSS
eukprot:2587925-Prorocentrum_lima.AAC.1